MSCATACSISSRIFSRRVVLQADDGGAEQLDAVLAQFARELDACRRPSAWRRLTCGDSRPIQIHETPSSTSSRMVYLRIALAEENT